MIITMWDEQIETKNMGQLCGKTELRFRANCKAEENVLVNYKRQKGLS